LPWIVAATAVIGAASAVVSGIQARGNAQDAQAYNNQVAAQNSAFRLEVMQWANEDYERNISNYTMNLGYEKETFGRAKDNAELQVKNVQKNYVAEIGTALLRSVQEDISTSLQLENTAGQVGATKGSLQARMADSGVAGNSANLVEGDVERQGGNARRAIERNREATQNQEKLQLLGIKAQRDTQLGSITLPTFAPLTPPSTPAPVSPVNPAAPVPIPSVAAIALNGISAGMSAGAGAGNLIKALQL
jgi:hypothetical protein